MDEIKQSDEIKQNNNHKRKVTAAIVFAIIAIIGIASVYFYVQYKSVHISTDDAFIEGDIYTIASKAPGTVKNIYVKTNQFVKKGELLLEIDAADLAVKVSEASSALNAEKAKIAEIDSRIVAARRQVEEAIAKADAIKAMNELREANLEQAEKDKERAENLLKKDAISREKYEKAMTAHKVAIAQVKAAAEDQKGVLFAVETQKAMIKQAEALKTAQLSLIKQKEAVLETARLNAGYTKLVAPADGFITKKSVEIGNQIQAGQPLMAIVSLDGVHVAANYKETQLEKVKPGMKVEMKVDAYPGKTFTGKVESIMAGTGAAFSLFPAENATGNFVKVVQRIPVKILFDRDADPKHVLRVGMSVVPTIVIEK
ncbi:MAG: HlyD family secretion protein [Nitrospira bacterium HGW-Nitrospira-1]|nr:MAG: HlyD family secretion protein [Nitrospira bacterium HGW-Nitrospira-1]